MADAQVSAAGGDVLGHHSQAAHQIVAALGERRAQQLGIGGDEVRRRQRARQLPQVELRLVARLRIEFVGARDEILGPAGRQHIGLLEEVEIGIVAPFGMVEALVAGVWRGDRRCGLALQPAQGRGPQIEKLARQRSLGGERPLGVGEVVFGDPAERRRHAGDVFAGLAEIAVFERLEIGGKHLAAFPDQLRKVARQEVEVGQERFTSGRVGVGGRRARRGDLRLGRRRLCRGGRTPHGALDRRGSVGVGVRDLRRRTRPRRLGWASGRLLGHGLLLRSVCGAVAGNPVSDIICG